MTIAHGQPDVEENPLPPEPPGTGLWTRRAALAGFVPGVAVLAFGTRSGRLQLSASGLSAAGSGAGNQGGNSQGNTTPAGALDVRLFGATGDGTSDDGPAFQKALDAAQSSGVGVVVVPPGTYQIGTALTATAPIRIVGIGGWSSTTLVFASSLSTGLSFQQPSTAVVYPGPAMQLVDLGLEYAGSGNIVQLNESQLPSPFQDTLISGCRFYLQGAGTGILTVNQRDAIITACQFLGSNSRTAVGIALSDSDNTKIENNVFYNLLYGVYGERAANRVFDSGCLIIGNSMYGFQDALHFEGWELVQAMGNIVDGANGNCFYLLDCYHSLIADNYLGVNGTSQGILIETQQPYGVGFLGQITFRGNYINHYEGASGEATIAVTGVSATLPEDQVIIDGNIVNGYPQYAVELTNAQNVVVRGNTFSAAASGSVTVLDNNPGKNYIVGNIVDGAITAAGDVVEDNHQLYAYPT